MIEDIIDGKMYSFLGYTNALIFVWMPATLTFFKCRFIGFGYFIHHMFKEINYCLMKLGDDLKMVNIKILFDII